MELNIKLFNYSKNHPENYLDDFYVKTLMVIPLKKEFRNTLTDNNSELIKLISAFDVLYSDDYDFKDNNIQKIIDKIIQILDKTNHINYSAFVQFFMVYNFSFSLYKKLDEKEKKSLIYEMLIKYCSQRHNTYLSHGYTDTILQVMCDNYSHKRNSKSTIDKIIHFITPYGFTRLRDKNNLISSTDYYFLPDKGDRTIFEEMLNKLHIEMKSRSIEHEKLPDIVFKHKDQYYICELKTMKESGGGQDKQIVELAYFIKFSEKDKNIHYLAFLDGTYANKIFQDKSPKIKTQRNDIKNILNANLGNYFLNTKGFKKFIEKIF